MQLTLWAVIACQMHFVGFAGSPHWPWPVKNPSMGGLEEETGI